MLILVHLADHFICNTASYNAYTTYLASCKLRQRGGCNLSTFPKTPPFPNNSLLSLVSYISKFASSFPGYFVYLSLTISTPTINPFPRTSPIILCFLDSFVSSVNK